MLETESNRRPFIIPVFLPHAGCPHHCVFCNQTAITGVAREVLSPETLNLNVREFLNFSGRRRRPVQIAFYGGNFLGLTQDYIHGLLYEATKFVNAGSVDSIRFSTRPDTINPDTIDLLDNYPISTVEIGVQSMDDRVLTLSNRGHNSLASKKAIALLKERNYEVGVQMMVGLPGDDEAKSETTARKLIDLRPDFIRIYPTLVLAGSRLSHWYQAGSYSPWSLERSVRHVKNLYLLFRKGKIPVIRMGLQASEELEKGVAVIAGPYHPAFGHMVHSEIFLDMAISILEAEKALNSKIQIKVHPLSISKMRGLKNKNVNILKSRFQIQTLKIVPDTSLAEDKLIVSRKR